MNSGAAWYCLGAHQQSLPNFAPLTPGLGSFSLGLLHAAAVLTQCDMQGLHFKQELPHSRF